MSRKLSITLLLVLITVIGTGCGLLGFNGGIDKKIELEATIDTLTAAGERHDDLTVEQHLATSIVTRVLNGEGLENDPPQGREALIAELQKSWANMTTNNIEVQLTELSIRGLNAVAHGTFKLEFEDNENNHVVCVGTGTANFSYSNGSWILTEVIIVDSDCEKTPGNEDPGNGDPGNEEPGDEDPSEPGEPGQPGEPGDPGLGPVPPGVPYFAADQCLYLTLGMKGPQAKALQESLNYLGYSAGRADGDYGIITERAVRQFQRDNRLYVDGEFGRKTMEALDERLRRDGGYFHCGTIQEAPDVGETYVTHMALRPGTAFETPVIQYDSPNPGPTLVFVGCIHGNERSGHLALKDAIDGGITISRGRLIIVPEFNKLACDANRRTLSRSGSLLSGKDFNRMFPVGSNPTYLIARELWDIIRNQPDLAFVVDFHDGFVNSLANTLLHTRQTKASRVAQSIRDNLNEVRPSGATGPKWRAFSEPVSGSLIRKVGRDLGVPGILVELAGRSPGDPVRLRKEYAWRIIRLLGREHDMAIGIKTF